MAEPPRRPSAFSQYRVLLAKDLRREFRTREMLTSMGIYAVLVLIVYGAAFSRSSQAFDITQMAGGLYWALVLFTSLLGLNRSFTAEKEQGCLEGILLVPLDRSLIFLAKASANLLFLLLIEAVTLPLFYFFFLTQASLATSSWLALVPLLIGSVGVSGVGTLLATMTSNTRGRDVMLAVLLIPLIFPLLYACVAATTTVVIASAGYMDSFAVSTALAVGYDIIMVLLSWVLYDFVVGV